MSLKYLKILSRSITFFLLIFAVNEIKPVSAETNFSNLVYCKDSPSFQKRMATATKKIETRLSLYQKNTKEYNALVKKLESTKERFEKYSKANLLCGKEGLPRIIATGQWDHAAEFTLPGILFIYITGWIGWVGRKYLQWTLSTENAFENEIILNLPVAISIANSGFLWPLDAWKELTSGNLIASKDDITISPR
jgi:photosystem I subunit 3